MNKLNFHAIDLAARVERLADSEIDDLPFGVIKLRADHVVEKYSKCEARLSGYGSRPALGLDYFINVAPCMGAPAYKGRIEQALRSGKVDIEMSWIGDFEDREREMNVRIQSAEDGGLWIFTQRPDAAG